MASMHLMGETLLWACGAGLAAAAVGSGPRRDDSERLCDRVPDTGQPQLVLLEPL
ncbi:hypothetical protein [Streptomyces sp. SD31]|uniref:hypothetical protein n=1 Tax=Streptomyces sp. SD31 TaxID=3452208 RepID=UPI003F8A0563